MKRLMFTVMAVGLLSASNKVSAYVTLADIRMAQGRLRDKYTENGTKKPSAKPGAKGRWPKGKANRVPFDSRSAIAYP